MIYIELTLYYWILVLENGFVLEPTSVLSVVDHWFFGDDYLEGRIIDSEGVLSSLPAVAHVMIGFYVGKIMMETENLRDKMLRLLLIGSVLAFSGYMLSYACPINKLIWSPTFVLVTTGLASALLAVLMWLIDGKGCKQWSTFFNVFGVNPLFMYVFSDFIAVLLGNLYVCGGDNPLSVHTYVYTEWLAPVFGNTLGSLVYAILFVLLNWCIGYVLYKKRIYIKI